MLQDPNVERVIKNYIEPLQKQISMLQNELGAIKKQCNIANVDKRIFIVFANRKDPLNEAREIVKVFKSEVAAVTWIADKNPKKYYYEVHKVG